MAIKVTVLALLVRSGLEVFAYQEMSLSIDTVSRTAVVGLIALTIYEGLGWFNNYTKTVEEQPSGSEEEWF